MSSARWGSMRRSIRELEKQLQVAAVASGDERGKIRGLVHMLLQQERGLEDRARVARLDLELGMDERIEAREAWGCARSAAAREKAPE